MKNFNNCLLGIEINEKCFNYLKDALEQKYDFTLFNDLLSLPCMQFEVKHKLLLLFALLEDGEINDTIINTLCSLLINISARMWDDFSERVEMLVESKYVLLSRSQKLRLAHTIEVMYAKGYEHSFDLANLIYQRIAESDKDFNPDSEENVRVRLAKIAYSTSKYNFNEKIAAINTIKHHLKSCGRKYLLGIVHYYKGLCLKITGTTIDYKDDSYYMRKAKERDFALASIYLNYGINNLETSRES